MFDKPVRSHNRWFGAATIALLLAAVAVARALPDWDEKDEKLPGYTFLAVAGLLVAALVCAGIAVGGRYSGAIVDGRGRYSLSRLQMLAWTVLVLAGFSTAIGTNIVRGSADPGNVAIPGELIALLGISAASAVFAQTIKMYNGTRGLLAVNRADTTHVDPAGKPVREGAVDVHKARVSDLIQGEEPGTKDLVAIGKIQNLYFTIIALSVYGWLVWNTLVTKASPDGSNGEGNPFITTMPSINEALVAIILISHAGYLTFKAIPSQNSAANGDAATAVESPAMAPEDRPAALMGGKG